VRRLRASAQDVFQLLQPRLVFAAEGLNFTVERLQLAFVGSLLGCELTVEDTNLIAEELDSLLDLGQVALARGGRALLASIDLIEPGGQGDEACDRHDDRKPQSCIPITHTAQLQGVSSTSSTVLMSITTIGPAKSSPPQFGRQSPLAFADGRVAQSAERVCEQHETMVRTHSPAAILALGLTLNRPGRFK
jgi:hypothetical protein